MTGVTNFFPWKAVVRLPPYQNLKYMTDQVFFYLPVEVLKPERELSNGKKFPMISFGTSEIEGFENVYNAVDIALETGYRSFDCSPKNKQEEYLGRALQELLPKYKLERNNVLICTKIHPKDYESDFTSEAVRRSCENLLTDYIDLYLLQWPGGFNIKWEMEDNKYLRQEAWKELIKLRSKGYIKTIGVCHFTVKQLRSLKASTGVLPAVNQVEFHPKFPQTELLQYCKENKILVQAHSFKDTLHPLTTADLVIKEIAKDINKSPTQVVLKWMINKGVAVICQSTSPAKIRQNFQLYDFVLDKPAMDSINAIQIREKYFLNTICIV